MHKYCRFYKHSNIKLCSSTSKYTAGNRFPVFDRDRKAFSKDLLQPKHQFPSNWKYLPRQKYLYFIFSKVGIRNFTAARIAVTGSNWSERDSHCLPAFPGNLYDKICPFVKAAKVHFPADSQTASSRRLPHLYFPLFTMAIFISAIPPKAVTAMDCHLTLISFAILHDFTQHPEDCVQLHTLNSTYSRIFPVSHEFFLKKKQASKPIYILFFTISPSRQVSATWEHCR